MEKSLKIATTATVLSTLAFNLNTAVAQTWTQRTVSEVQATLSSQTDGVYVIQWGDTLSTIATATGHSVAQLAAVNAIADADFIVAGSVLYFDEANNTVTYVNNDTAEVATVELPVVEEVTEATYVVEPTVEWVAPTEEVVEVTEALVIEETVAEVADLPVVEATTVEVTEAPVIEETVVEVTELPVVEETTVEVTEAPIVEETVVEVTELPVVEATTVEVTEAPVVEATTVAMTEAPVVEETTVVEVTEPVATTVDGVRYNEYGGIYSEAKEWIAMKESGGQYEIWNPTGTYYGRYQLTASYLNGDFSRENQERVADKYVMDRYGSWEAALEFWKQNNWY